MSLGRNPRKVLLGALCLLSLSGSRPSIGRPSIRKTIIVGTDNAPPYYFQNANGEVVGVAVDVLRRAAAQLDFDVRFVHLSGQPDRFLRSGEADIWPVLTITKERTSEFHMTEPWLYNTFCLLHLRKSAVPNVSSLRLAHWSNPANTRIAKEFFPQSHFISRPTREAVMQAVCSGEVDAGFIETRVLNSLLLTRPEGCAGANLARQSIPDAAYPMGIAAVKSAGREADRLHRQITKMASSGELGRLFDKWSSITANEVNSIVAMNAARQRSHLAYGGIALVIFVSCIVFWHSRKVRRAFGVADREAAERRRAEEAHRNADRVRNMVLEGAGEGICGLDAQGRTTFLNSTAATLLGYESKLSEGQDFHALVHGSDLGACSGPDCALDAGKKQIAESRIDIGQFRRGDGTVFPVAFIYSPLFDRGVYAGSVISFSDITARRQAEVLDRDRNAVLEMLAENRSLTEIFSAITALVERQCRGLFCVISAVDRQSLKTPATLPVGVAPDWCNPILSSTNDVLGTVALYGQAAGELEVEHQTILQVACRLARLAIEQTRLNHQLHHQAHHDSLTGLPNRLMFEERLGESLAAARHSRRSCAVFYIDLDRFKQINDTLSHRVGDLYLCQVSWRLQGVLPPSATLARLGGDEFAVVLPNVRNSSEADHLAREMLQAMKQPFSLDGFTLFGTASIGIGLSSPHGTPAELQSCADQAMYRAKSQGRNCYQFYSSDMSRGAIAQLEIEQCIREALERDRFVLHYQPQCRANGDLVGFEALIRMRHAERGFIPPNDFIPVAEDTGLILPIGSWVLREACRQLAIWRTAGMTFITVAINVSAAQISQGNFAEEVTAVLCENDLPPSSLEIELTESMIMSNFDQSLAQIARLRALGVKLSIDDFGTGYSSLSHLHRLPVHTIKIDQSFVRAMDSEVSTRPLVEAIVAAARSLKCNVVAEGVETDAQRRDLARMGCDHMQGFFFSRPLPAAEVLKQFEAMAIAS